MNYDFDFKKIPFEFSLEPFCGSYEACRILGPGDLFHNEALRREIHSEVEWGTPVPTDIFLMAQGEPENRATTKVGGLPFRSKRQEWPVAPNGRPMGLVAQFNFSNSRDIFPQLPGDVLLIFGDNWATGEVHHVEWQKLGITDLVDDLPKGSMYVPPCYGYRYRTANYPDAKLINTDEAFPILRGLPVLGVRQLFCYSATQIGTAPFFHDGPVGPPDAYVLCTISSMWPATFRPYPWVNKPKSIDEEPCIRPENDELLFTDVRSYFLFMNQKGEVLYLDEPFQAGNSW